jgi:hypothetical protein
MNKKFFILNVLIVLLLLNGCTYLRENNNGLKTERSESFDVNRNFSPSSIEIEIFESINKVRRSMNLSTLDYDIEASALARNYSLRMLKEKFFDHVSPEGDDVEKRLRDFKITYSSVGENLAYISITNDIATKAVNGWLKSPKHRETMLSNNYNKLGVGVACGDIFCYITTIYLNKTFYNEVEKGNWGYFILNITLNGPTFLELTFNDSVKVIVMNKEELKKFKKGEPYKYYFSTEGKKAFFYIEEEDQILIFTNNSISIKTDVVK